MAYTKTVWFDRQVQYPLTFTLTSAPNGGTTLVPNEGTITNAGTPITASNMNKIENGVADVDSRLSTVETSVPNKLDKSGGTLTGALIGTSLTMNSITTGAITVNGDVTVANNIYTATGNLHSTELTTGNPQMMATSTTTIFSGNVATPYRMESSVRPILNLAGDNQNLMTDFNIQSGTVSITPVANTPTSVRVTFSKPFSSNPIMQCTPNTNAPGTVVTGVGFSGLSPTGVDIWVTRVTNTVTPVHWVAIGS